MPSLETLESVRRSIRTGEDPLGVEFCRVRPPGARRRVGAVYTPRSIVEEMVRWAADAGTPARVVDPGAGSGRFLLAAGRAFPDAELVAVELDPLAALVIRANAQVLGMADRLAVQVADYRSISLPAIKGSTLFIGNPPYVRHHDVEPDSKEWFALSASELGLRASKLAGAHVHFFLKTRQLARRGDYGAFITSAEWLDVNYGVTVRDLLVDGLGGVSVQAIAPTAMPFPDATTTGVIACFRVDRSTDSMMFRSIEKVSGLAGLSTGHPVTLSRLKTEPRWSNFTRNSIRSRPRNYVELGEICRVHRGQVTGCNAVWISGEHTPRLPNVYLKPCVTKARELIAATPRLQSATGLRRVVDLPIDLDELGLHDRQRVQEFLQWAAAMGAANSYIAKNRRAWWAVGLKQPAPILCTYMARRPPTFVRNECASYHLNIAHGIYPREELDLHVLDSLSKWLQANVCVSDGRTYAGGLTKFEPRELERVLVPPLGELNA